ncbi:hypothetical protein ACW9YV_11235 [Paraburkholderia strydomiana]
MRTDLKETHASAIEIGNALAAARSDTFKSSSQVHGLATTVNGFDEFSVRMAMFSGPSRAVMNMIVPAPLLRRCYEIRFRFQDDASEAGMRSMRAETASRTAARRGDE